MRDGRQCCKGQTHATGSGRHMQQSARAYVLQKKVVTAIASAETHAISAACNSGYEGWREERDEGAESLQLIIVMQLGDVRYSLSSSTLLSKFE